MICVFNQKCSSLLMSAEAGFAQALVSKDTKEPVSSLEGGGDLGDIICGVLTNCDKLRVSNSEDGL